MRNKKELEKLQKENRRLGTIILKLITDKSFFNDYKNRFFNKVNEIYGVKMEIEELEVIGNYVESQKLAYSFMNEEALISLIKTMRTIKRLLN